MGGKNRRGRKSSPPHQGDVKRGRADEVVVRPVHHVVSETGELPNDAVARLFHVAEKRCNHKKAANCTENPNCLTGLARPRTGPVWDEDALAALVHKTTGEVESPAEVLRDATVVVLAPDDVHAANAAAQVEAATGLRNMGATCYMNALLQVLFAIAPLRRGLYQYAGPRQGATVAHHVVDELVLLFARMQQGNAKWLRPHMLPELLDFSTSEQQDVQEFFQLFLGNVCEPALKSCPATSALLQTLFEGHVRKGTVCPLCNHESKRAEMFTLLSVPVDASLEASLEAYTRAEQLEGENRVECSGCGARVNATLTTRLTLPLPPVLAVQVVRFVYDATSNNKKKRLTTVSAPRQLDVAPYVEGGAAAGAGCAPYDLFAVICHIGATAHGGHYVAHVCTPSGQWIELDDETVRPLKPEQVGLTLLQRQGGGGKKSEVDDDFEVKKSAGKRGGAVKPSIDLTKHTRGSPTPYLFFYRARDAAAAWYADTCPLPEALARRVAEENQALEQRVDAYNAQAAKLASHFAELRQSCEQVLEGVEEGDGNYYWIATAWLEAWLADPDAHIERPISNDSILCQHGGVDPDRISQQKRISSTAWAQLVSRWGGGPELTAEAACTVCMLEHCRKLAEKEGITSSLQQLRALSKEKPPAMTGFWVSTSWLSEWRKGRDPPPGDVNAGLACPHNNLCIEEKMATAVVGEVWAHLKELRPESREWLVRDSVRCPECESDRQSAEEAARSVQAMRERQKRQCGTLATTNKGCAPLAHLQRGLHYAVPAEWVREWRAWLERTDSSPVSAIRTALLLCPHGLLCYSLKHELLDRSPTDPSFLYIVTEKDWQFLVDHVGLGLDQATICIRVFDNDTVGLSFDSEPGECSDCVARVQAEKQAARASFVNEAVHVRIGHGNPSLQAAAAHSRRTTRSSKNSGPSTVDVLASSSTALYHFKMLLFAALPDGADPARYRLSFNGTPMREPEAPLEAWGICAGDTVDLEVSLGVDCEDDDDDFSLEVADSRQRAGRKPERGFAGSKLTGGGGGGAVAPRDDQRAPAPAEDRSWTCATCTFLNKPMALACDMCQSLKTADAKRHKSDSDE